MRGIKVRTVNARRQASLSNKASLPVSTVEHWRPHQKQATNKTDSLQLEELHYMLRALVHLPLELGQGSTQPGQGCCRAFLGTLSLSHRPQLGLKLTSVIKAVPAVSQQCTGSRLQRADGTAVYCCIYFSDHLRLKFLG